MMEYTEEEKTRFKNFVIKSITFYGTLLFLIAIPFGIINGWTHDLVLFIYSTSILPITVSIFLRMWLNIKKSKHDGKFVDPFERFVFYFTCLSVGIMMAGVITEGISRIYIINLIFSHLSISFLMLYRISEIKRGLSSSNGER